MSRSMQHAVYLVRQARVADTMGEKVESLIKAMEQLIEAVAKLENK